MTPVNFNHLRCFLAVAREGGMTAASRRLGISQPTISKQVGDLEESMGVRLLRRSGRRLLLTETGRSVLAYAEEIFALAQEMSESVGARHAGKALRLHVGVSDVVPKLLTRLVLEPALQMQRDIRLTCREGKLEHLLADLSLGALDAVISDAPVPSSSSGRTYSRCVGGSSVGVFGRPELVARARGSFPDSLSEVPMLLPTQGAHLRRSIDVWLGARDIRPDIIGEFEDSALMKAFGEAGHGVFFAPMAVREQMKRQLGVELVAEVDEIIESIYVVTLERKIVHVGIEAIVERAQATLGQV
jgi:LysR family transcriptional activator of nhaA